jgi:hypothetical protein
MVGTLNGVFVSDSSAPAVPIPSDIRIVVMVRECFSITPSPIASTLTTLHPKCDPKFGASMVTCKSFDLNNKPSVLMGFNQKPLKKKAFSPYGRCLNPARLNSTFIWP